MDLEMQSRFPAALLLMPHDFLQWIHGLQDDPSEPTQCLSTGNPPHCIPFHFPGCQENRACCPKPLSGTISDLPLRVAKR